MPKQFALLPLLALLACRADAQRPKGNPEVESFLAAYAKDYQRLNYASALAEWASNTHIVEGDSSNAIRTRKANEERARFVGSVANIAQIRNYLQQRDRLTPLEDRQ